MAERDENPSGGTTPGPSGSWRVVAARLPTGASQTPPGAPPPLGPTTPVLQGASWAEATAVVERLQRMGGTASVLADAGVCAVHPTELAGTRCVTCAAWICGQCRGDAEGLSACAACTRKAKTKAGYKRLRTLFSMFLFAAFLFEVSRYIRREAAALEPPVAVSIVQFAPSYLLRDPRIRAINQPDGDGGRSLHDIATFYAQEYARYTGRDERLLEVTIRGPWEENVRPPTLGDRDASWWELLLVSWQYPRYFHSLARSHGFDPDAFGARLYIVWTDSEGDVSADSRGSQKGRVGITWLSVDEPNLAYSVVSVAHELGHILGAIDTYEEGSYLSHWPEGYVEPFAVPLWPQRWAELMAVDKPASPNSEREVQSLFEQRIGYDSAARMGWIAPEQAELYYAPRLTMPEQTLQLIEQASDRAAARTEAQRLGPVGESMNPAAIGPLFPGVDEAPPAESDPAFIGPVAPPPPGDPAPVTAAPEPPAP